MNCHVATSLPRRAFLRRLSAGMVLWPFIPGIDRLAEAQMRPGVGAPRLRWSLVNRPQLVAALVLMLLSQPAPLARAMVRNWFKNALLCFMMPH